MDLSGDGVGWRQYGQAVETCAAGQTVGCDLDIVDEFCFHCFEFGNPALHPFGHEVLGVEGIYLEAISRDEQLTVVGRRENIAQAKPKVGNHPLSLGNSIMFAPRAVRHIFLPVLAVLVFSFWHAFPSVPTQSQDFMGGSDAGYSIWLFNWLLEHLARLDLQNLYQGNIFYPLEHTAAFSCNTLVQAVTVLPLYLLTGDVSRCYNIACFLTYPLCFLGMFLLCRSASASIAASLAGATIFAFTEYRLNMIGYLHHLSMQWIPFCFLHLIRYFQCGGKRHAWLFSLFYVLNACSSEHYFIFGNFFFALFLAAFLARKDVDTKEFLKVFLAPGLCAAALTSLVYYPFLIASKSNVFARQLWEQVFYSADLINYLGAKHTLLMGAAAQGFSAVERILWPTFSGLALAAVALYTGRAAKGRSRGVLPSLIFTVALAALILVAHLVRKGSTFDRFEFLHAVRASALSWPHAGLMAVGFAAICVLLHKSFLRATSSGKENLILNVSLFMLLTTALLTFGPVINVASWALAYNPVSFVFFHIVPGGDAIRTLPRAFAFFSLFLALLAAFGFTRLQAMGGRGVLASWVLGLLLLADVIPAKSFSFVPETRISETPEELLFLSRLPGSPPMLELPLGDGSLATERSRIHRLPLFNGYASYFWDGYASLSESLDRHGLEGSLGMIRDFGIQIILVRDASDRMAGEALTAHGYRLIGEFPDARVYQNQSARLNRLQDQDFARARPAIIRYSHERLGLMLHFDFADSCRVSTRMQKVRIVLDFPDGSREVGEVRIGPGVWCDDFEVDTLERGLSFSTRTGTLPERITLNGRYVFRVDGQEAQVREAGRNERMKDLTRISDALIRYYVKYDRFPLGGVGDIQGRDGRFNPNWIDGLVPEFLSELPRDPRHSNKYWKQYTYISDGLNFKLIARNPEDCYEATFIDPSIADPKNPCAYGFYLPGAADW